MGQLDRHLIMNMVFRKLDPGVSVSMSWAWQLQYARDTMVPYLLAGGL